MRMNFGEVLPRPNGESPIRVPTPAPTPAPSPTPKVQGINFPKRLTRFMAFVGVGFDKGDAQALAYQLEERDRDYFDKRRACLECANIGNQWRGLTCTNHRMAGLNVPDIGRDYASLLKHCNGFHEVHHD